MLLTHQKWDYVEWSLTYAQSTAILMTNAAQNGAKVLLKNKDITDIKESITNLF